MYGFDDSRDRLILELRKSVAKGDSPLNVGDYFTVSFNMACGSRSFMEHIWQVKALTAQQVYAVGVLNTAGLEEANSTYGHVGKSHMFDRGEHQFYDATDIYKAIAAERQASIDAAKLAQEPAMFEPEPDEVEA